MPEWTEFGNLIPAQHLIYLDSIRYPIPRPTLSRDESCWPCSRSASRQIRHHRARAIAWNLFDDEMTHYKLVAEDLIQKIKVSPLRPNIEVPFKFFTAHTQLLEHYENEYTIHTNIEVPYDDEGDDDGHGY